MRGDAFPEYETHKEDHEELLDEIRAFMNRVYEDPQSGMELL